MRHRITEHLACGLQGAFCNVKRTALLDGFGHVHQGRGFNLVDWLGADGGEHIGLKPSHDVFDMTVAAVIFPMQPPEPRYSFKGVARCDQLRPFDRFSLHHGVYVLG